MKRIVSLVIAAICVIAAIAQEGSIDKDDPVAFDLSAWTNENLPILTLTPSVAATYELSEGFSTRETFDISYLAESFALTMMVSVNNDNKYTPDIANTTTGTLFGNYLLMESGGIAFREGALSIRIGRLPQYDVIDSPYSLFISSLGHTANTIEINYERGKFFYQSRFISLNANSDQIYYATSADSASEWYAAKGADGETTWPDRGANMKVYGFHFGDMRFGIQELVVYCGTAFDWEYLINPSIGYLIQYVRGTDGRPWSTGSNDNYAIGGFWDWNRQDGWAFDAQFFLDDGNTHWLTETSPDIPFKFSWTAGARKKTSLGSFGFHTAGATKYTYQTTLTEFGNIYSYSYYPDILYNAGGDSNPDWTMIDYEDNYIGYKYGANNLAFCGEYRNEIFGFDMGADLEFAVDGNKAPTNTWDERAQSGGSQVNTHWLDDNVLQYKIVLTAKASRQFGNFVVFGSLKLGYVWNKISYSICGVSNLADTESETYTIDKYMAIYTPQSGVNEPIIKISLGGKYILPLK